MKKLLMIAAVIAAFAGIHSCTPQADETPVALEILDYTLAESATFGQSLEFSVSVPEKANAQNVTAALIQGGKTLSSVTIREAVGGVFSGNLEIPYVKNAED